MSAALQYPTARHFNIIALIIAFGIGMLLPALAAYFVGDRATKSKKPTLHHYNGVLFGLAAFWLNLGLSTLHFVQLLNVPSEPIGLQLLINSTLPVLLTISILGVVAVLFAKNPKKNSSVLHYRPYQLLLLASIVSSITIPYLTTTSGLPVGALAGLGITGAIVFTAYIVLRREHTNVLDCITDAAIAMSIGWLAAMGASSFFTVINAPYESAGVVGIVVFAAYLYLRVRR